MPLRNVTRHQLSCEFGLKSIMVLNCIQINWYNSVFFSQDDLDMDDDDLLNDDDDDLLDD